MQIIFFIFCFLFIKQQNSIYYFPGGCCFSFIPGKDKKFQCRNSENRSLCKGDFDMQKYDTLFKIIGDQQDIIKVIEQIDERIRDDLMDIVDKNSYLFMSNSYLLNNNITQCPFGITDCDESQIIFLQNSLGMDTYNSILQQSKQEIQIEEQEIQIKEQINDDIL